MVNAFKYVIENGGICKDSDYNYLGYVSKLSQCVCIHRWLVAINISVHSLKHIPGFPTYDHFSMYERQRERV